MMAAAYEDSSYSSSASSDSEYSREHLEDLSYGTLDTLPECTLQRSTVIHSLKLDNNEITSLPSSIGLFKKLIVLDISANKMSFISDEICQLPKLRTLIAKNNHLTTASFPKGLNSLKSLEVLNVSGNEIENFPPQFTELEKLQVLHMGSNCLKRLPSSIKLLSK